jgi:conserved oligomeric Golgi complex subunit 5
VVKSYISAFNIVLTRCCRLKTRIRVPYQSLQENVSRLQKLQQAAELLRRISRFVILEKRLQTQVAEMERFSATNNPPSEKLQGTSSDNPYSEDEKDRALAKAALSIAELGIVFFP